MGAPQELIAGRYRLLRRIAAGGMGVVWEARDELLERPVAIKQLHTQVGVPEEEAAFAKQRAMREGRITARLHHPNAVVVFDSVEHEGEPCLVMQYVPSEPLSAGLKAHGALPVGEVARIGAQIAAALAAAHDLGIVHRDVKPGNILIRDEDRAAMLSDFGISHALGDATVTSTSLVHGTPAYLAPEVARGEESSFASDVFSLGSTLYAASEGEAPFGEAPNSIAVLHRVASGGFPAPKRSGALGALLMQMMADDPEARPLMRDVALRLAALEAEEHGSEPPTIPLVTGEDTDTALIATDHRTAVLETVPAADEVDDGPATEESVPARTLAVPAAVPVATAAAAGAGAAAPPDEPERPAPDEQDPAGRPRRRRRMLIGALAAAVLVLVGGLGLVRLLQPGTTAPRATAAAPVSTPVTSSAPASPSATPTTPAPSPTPTSASPTPAPTSAAPTPTSTPSATPRTTTSPSAGSGAPTAAASAAAISRYYGLVPGDLGSAWSLLTTDYQVDHAGGRAAFDRFWAPISGVSASFVRATGSDSVRATITYRYRTSRVVTEDTSFRLVSDGGVLKIAGSTVISSTG